jgi:hypothetical protein
MASLPTKVIGSVGKPSFPSTRRRWHFSQPKDNQRAFCDPARGKPRPEQRGLPRTESPTSLESLGRCRQDLIHERRRQAFDVASIAGGHIEGAGLISAHDAGCFSVLQWHGEAHATRKAAAVGNRQDDWAGREPVESFRRDDHHGPVPAMVAALDVARVIGREQLVACVDGATPQLARRDGPRISLHLGAMDHPFILARQSPP